MQSDYHNRAPPPTPLRGKRRPVVRVLSTANERRAMGDGRTTARVSPYARKPIYRLTTTMGKQTLSTRKTSFGDGVPFGKGTRDAFDKVYLSAEHAKCTPSNVSPGPAYTLSGCIGEVIDARYPTMPSPKFPSSDRNKLGTTRDSMHVLDPCAKIGISPPGPGKYELAPAVGAQVDSTKHSRPRHSLPRSTREQAQGLYDAATSKYNSAGNAWSPAAKYATVSSVGPQPESVKRTAPAAAFAKGGRWSSDKNAAQRPGPDRYTLPSGGVGKQTADYGATKKVTEPTAIFGTLKRDQRDKVMGGTVGMLSPGPCGSHATPRSCVGRQSSSREPTSPTVKFGTSTREPKLEVGSTGPGPGAYNV